MINPQDDDSAFRLVFNGGWTHSPQGATPNGTNGYADTFLIASSVLTESSKHLSFYINTDNTPINSDPINIGALSGFSSDFLLSKRNLVNAQLSAVLVQNSTFSNPSGFSLATRTSTTNNLFKNASKVNAVTGSGTNSTTKMFVGALNLSGVNYGFTNNQFAIATIGDGLTDTQAANLYTRVQTFNQTLGRQVGVPIVSDADAQAFLNSAEITDLTQANAINTLVTDLKTQGLWTKMKAVYPFVGGTASTHKWNLKDPRDLDAAYRLVFNGGWTHSSTGATPNGTNGFADTFLTPSSVLTLNNTHLSFYSRTSAIVNGQRDMGVFVNGNNPCMSLGTNTGVQLSDSYSFATNRISASIANALGFVNGTRTSSTSHKLFKSGTQIGTTDVFANVTALPNQRVYLGAVNTTPDLTLVQGYSTKQNAFTSIGDGLTDSEAAALYTAVQTYQTTLSRQV
jgi:hypothetical protein